MKKVCCCQSCNYEFEVIINNMEEYNNVFCPKCNNKVNLNYRKPKQISKIDRKANNVFNILIKIYAYFYLIFGTLGLIGFIIGSTLLFKTSAIIALIVYIIELLFGYIRNIFGLFGIIISSLICIFITNDIVKGIYLGGCIIFILSALIKILFFKLLIILDKKLTKKK